MDVKYTTGQDDRDVSNPVYDKQLEGEIQLDDHFSVPDEALKNPLFLDGKEKTDVMKIIMFVAQLVTILLVIIVMVICIVTAVNVYPEPGLLVGSSTSCPTNQNISDQYASLLSNVAQILQVTRNVSKQTGLFEVFSSAYQNSSRAIYDIVGTLSNLKDTSTATAGAVNDILLAVGDILDLQNGSSLFNSIQTVSCQDIKSAYPNSPTGYYHVNNRDIYCNMDQLCNSGGGWTRLGFFDMSDATTNCPDGFGLYAYSNVRACGRAATGVASCAPSIRLDTNGISYTQICGRVTGYQHGTPDAVDTRGNPTQDLNSHYLDGVSITRGSPREHVWSMIGGVSDGAYDDGNCPCNDPPGGTQNIRAFMGNNYFCESANPSTYSFVFFPADPLWDGQGCGSMEGPCCAAPGLPWFNRDYGNMSSTDFIELRVCGNQGTGDEDTPISLYEIYVK